MTHVFTCSHGHRWEANDDQDTHLLDRPPVCPVCAAAAAPGAEAESTWTGAVDPLPPPPRPAADTPVAGGPVPRPPGAPWPSVAGYEILEELGEGGMGVVYKARQLALNRVVALKMIRGAHAGAEELARFRIEAEAVARLQHPNIVQIYEVGQQDGRPFFSLEYVDGGSLDKLQARTLMPARQAAALVETLARAMHYAHQRGVVHRDLKPANILLQNANCKMQNANLPEDNLQFAFCNLHFAIPKISDFGLAKRLDVGTDKTRSGLILGTPSYMAPEQAGGKGVGPAADIYALGAILYDLVTGRPPFQAETPMDIIIQVVAEDPVPPSRLQPRLPRDLETICLKCLSKDPRRRYASAEELADDLHRFQSGEPIRARPAGWGERVIKWARRQPARATLAAVSAVAAVGLLVGGLWYADRERQRAEEADRQRRQAQEGRERAQKAEQEAHTQRLKAQRDRDRALKAERASYAQTAELALRRGDWHVGLQSLDKALQAGHPDRVGLRLAKVRVFVALNDVTHAAAEIQSLSRRSDLTQRQRGLVLLWQGDIAISRSFVHADEAQKLIRQAVAHGLPEADEAYAQALLASDSPSAVKHLRRALELDPYHPRANSTLIMTLILLGRLPEAREHLFFAEKFFPEDPTLVVLHALTDALGGNRKAGLARIDQAGQRIRERRHLATARDLVEVLSDFHDLENLIGDPNGRPWDLLLKMMPGFLKIALALPKDRRQKASPTQTPLLLPFPPAVGKAVGAMVPALLRARFDRKQARVLHEALQRHPEGLFYLLYAMTLAQQRRLEDSEEAFLLAESTPSMVPVRRAALLYAIYIEVALGNRRQGEAQTQMYRKAVSNLRKLVGLGNLPRYQYYYLSQLALDANQLDLAHWIIAQWQQLEPRNLDVLRRRLALEYQEGAYARVLRTADAILARKPNDRDAREYREGALLAMGMAGR
jgi:tetratricopeptide (TPR) repeat protein